MTNKKCVHIACAFEHNGECEKDEKYICEEKDRLEK